MVQVSLWSWAVLVGSSVWGGEEEGRREGAEPKLTPHFTSPNLSPPLQRALRQGHSEGMRGAMGLSIVSLPDFLGTHLRTFPPCLGPSLPFPSQLQPPQPPSQPVCRIYSPAQPTAANPSSFFHGHGLFGRPFPSLPPTQPSLPPPSLLSHSS